MDLQEIFAKLNSPDSYSEKFIFIALGIYCLGRVLLPFINFSGFESIFFFLHYLTALFGIALGAVILSKFARKIKGDFMRQGLFGLGLWLVAEGLVVLIPSFEDVFLLKMAVSFGAGAMLMIGLVSKNKVREEMGLFLLGLYLFLYVIFRVINMFGFLDDYYGQFSRYGCIFLLFMASLLLILRRSDESMLKEDVCGENPDVE